jgi:hypothetical protein
MEPTREEILEVVDTANNVFAEKAFEAGLQLDHITVAVYTECHGQKMVDILGNTVWDSENDLRKWVGSEWREDLNAYIMKETQAIVEGLCLVSRIAPRIISDLRIQLALAEQAIDLVCLPNSQVKASYYMTRDSSVDIKQRSN